MRLILAVTIPALMLFSPGWPAQAAPEQDLPRGLHDPDALTCNAPQLVPVAARQHGDVDRDLPIARDPRPD